jgi:hypothetical protein
MKKIKKYILSILLISSVLMTSCASTTIIQSNPNGAKIYVNGEPVGITPYAYTDTKIIGSTTTVRLEKEGFESLNTSFSRNEEVDVGAIIGGLIVLVPFLWTMKYKPVRNYELKASIANKTTTDNKVTQEIESKSKIEKLKELKILFDEKLISQEEYEKEKKKILN